MARIDRQPACPNCAEPLEEDDFFCGRCGSSLAAPPGVQDRPTLRLTGGGPLHGAAAGPGLPGGPNGADRSAGWGPAAGAPPVPSGMPAAPPWERAAGVPAGRPGTEPYRAHGAAGHSGELPYGSGHAPEPGYGPDPGHGADPGHAPGRDTGFGAGFGTAPARPSDPVPGAPAAIRHDGPDHGEPDHGHPHQEPPAAPRPLPEAPAAASGHEGPARTAPPAAGAPGRTCVACRAGRVDTDGYCEHCGHAQPRDRDHVEEELGSVAAVSDRGLRHHRNEDSFTVAATSLPEGSTATVAIVCDGVSSAARPDEASAAASAAAGESLLEALPRGVHPQQAMHEAIIAAGAAVDALAAESQGSQNAPACTLVGSVTMGGLLVIGWVGDSRAYWVPDDRGAPAARLTEDDSWAAQMVAAGLMNEAEAYADSRAHAITGWLGADAYELEPHTAAFKPDRPGVVVVCTDGLWNYAESAGEMARLLPPDAALHPLHAARVLVGHALDGGGHDNITVALVPVPGPPRA
ncbi:protein phosphatase 2C domain-containing protein [Streptomyces sp. NPDC097619]|uniref:protein phosphatase 2C domain-containing protein n=1 Tax=Streptomyces sp. NPDC097619 TaxID=3157228 RepID=UPI003326FF9C